MQTVVTNCPNCGGVTYKSIGGKDICPRCGYGAQGGPSSSDEGGQKKKSNETDLEIINKSADVAIAEGSETSVKEILAGLGGLLSMGALLLVGITIGAVFIFGAVWASTKLLPWFSILTLIAFGLVILIILPLAIPRATRGFSSVALFIASYVFGATLWMEGLLLTLFIWGLGAAIIGLFLAGVGVVPIAMLATLIKGMWGPLVELVLLTLMTFGSRMGALSLSESLEG